MFYHIEGRLDNLRNANHTACLTEPDLDHISSYQSWLEFSKNLRALGVKKCYAYDIITIYYITLSRVLQGRTGNFREIHFLKGFRDFFVNISTQALARVEILTKKSRNPERKWFSLNFLFSIK